MLFHAAFDLEPPGAQREFRLAKVVADEEQIRRRDGPLNFVQRKREILRFRPTWRLPPQGTGTRKNKNFSTGHGTRMSESHRKFSVASAQNVLEMLYQPFGDL